MKKGGNMGFVKTMICAMEQLYVKSFLQLSVRSDCCDPQETRIILNREAT